MHGRAQSGQAIVLIALMLAVVVGMAALAIDGSRAYAVRRDLQAAVDAAALAAADTMQRTSSYASAERAAIASFEVNLRIYGSPCAPAYGSPGAGSFTVNCNYADGTTLTQVVSALGPRGSQFQLTASRTLSLQFARILTNGSSPTIVSTSTGRVNNLLYSPALAALNQAGCGGAGGTAITVNGFGALNVTGDVVSSGSISIPSGSARVAGDIYARCQASVSGATTACYPSAASGPCSYPDVLGATRSGYHYADPGYSAPSVAGGNQGTPSGPVNLLPGTYTANPGFNSGDCWFLSGGVYSWQGGYTNSQDFVSNELKPPDEPNAGDNTQRASTQFWNTNGVNCAGSVQVSANDGPQGIPTAGTWSFVLTSTRVDTYNGLNYQRESAPSMCYTQLLRDTGENITIAVSNLPGATGYNIYAAPPNNGCSGQFGLAETLPVSVPVLNTRTNPCPSFNGNGCTLGHESITLNATDLGPSFVLNSVAAPGSPGSRPPDGETAPLLGFSFLANQNPPRGGGAAGDRANENNCDSTAGAYVTCPAPITPGAVEFYVPGSSCLSTTTRGDTYTFSGYQYDWVALYQARGNSCAVQLGGSQGSAYVGLVYAPSAPLTVSTAFAFETSESGGVIADTLTFTGLLPFVVFNAAYAPVPFAARLVS
jgi:Flp pilus assembly protein TadG